MTRRLFCILTIISALCTISCSREELNIQPGEPTSVTLNITFEEDDITRAISDGTSVDQLVYAVYNEDGQVIIPKAVKSDVTAFANKSALAFTISLPAGGNYKAVIWAQSSKC